MSLIPTFRPNAAIFIANAAKQIVLTNEGHLKLLGRSRNEVVGHSWQEWVASEDLQVVSTRVARFFANRQPYEALSHVVGPSGRIIPAIVQCSAVEGNTSEHVLLFCQVFPLDESLMRARPGQLECAEYVRDMTYDLAALTGRHYLPDLTQALVEVSASADHVVEALSSAAKG